MKGKNFDMKIMSGFKKSKSKPFNIHKPLIKINKPFKPFDNRLFNRVNIPLQNIKPLAKQSLNRGFKVHNKMTSDYDRDGVMNVMDCRPRNMFKQGPENHIDNEAYTGYYVKMTHKMHHQMLHDKDSVLPADDLSAADINRGVLMHVIPDDHDYDIYEDEGMSWQEAKQSRIPILSTSGPPGSRSISFLQFDEFAETFNW